MWKTLKTRIKKSETVEKKYGKLCIQLYEITPLAA